MSRKVSKAKLRTWLQACAEGVVVGKTKATIARELGVKAHALTFCNDENPDFMAEVERLITERRKRTSMQLEVMSALALKAHMEIMQDAAHRDRLAAAESTLDRVGLGKQTKVHQTLVSSGTLQVAMVDDFKGRSVEDLEHYAQHGRFPDGT